MKVWWRSGYLTARRSDLRKSLQTDRRTDRQTDDGRLAIALAHSWNELKTILKVGLYLTESLFIRYVTLRRRCRCRRIHRQRRNVRHRDGGAKTAAPKCPEPLFIYYATNSAEWKETYKLGGLLFSRPTLHTVSRWCYAVLGACRQSFRISATDERRHHVGLLCR